jgi:hypothetical protein
MNYGDALKAWSPEKWQSFGARGGIVDDSMNLFEPTTETSGLASLGSGLSAYAPAIQAGAVLGQTYSNLFGDGKKKNKLEMQGMKEQIGLLKEQRAANQEALANRRQFNNNWANSSNKGLGASSNSGVFA